MEFLSNYGLYLAKLATFTVFLIIIIGFIFGIITYGKTKAQLQGKLVVRKLNDKYREYKDTLSYILKRKSEIKRLLKLQKKELKEKNTSKNPVKRIFVLNFTGDIRASAVAALREEITAVLTVAEKTDEILLRLDSAGGLVNAYGLAASQLQRIKDKGIPLVVTIDKIAASGGYMMACVADRILAAPFAIIGSIGVIAQLPNFHRYLQKKHIDFEQVMAGEYKRTLTVFGENTEKDRSKMQQEINEIHALFKSYIKEHRPMVDIDRVATGEHWYGTQAIPLQLIDELRTSDDYLLSKNRDCDLIEVCYKIKKPLGQRMSQNLSHLYHKLLGTLETRGRDYISW